MGIIKAFSGALEGTIADQWKEIIVPDSFSEHTVLVSGVVRCRNKGRGANLNGSIGIISNGSKIYVPDNTAAVIIRESGIAGIITEPGGYEYQSDQKSIFNSDGVGASIFGQIKDRIAYGGISPDHMRIAYVNLREIRDIKFGTKGAQVYNDVFYGADLEIYAHGTFSIKVTDPVKFLNEFVPPNTVMYSFDMPRVRGQLLSEFLQSFAVSLNSLSTSYRISQLPSQSNRIAEKILNDEYNAGSWENRFGFKITKVAIENIEFSDQSRELVRQFSLNRMNVNAYENVSQKASNIAAQQKFAQGIKDHGLGNAAGTIFGVNMVQNLGANAESKPTMSFNEQIEALKKLKDLLDAGILDQQEFDVKKKEIMGL